MILITVLLFFLNTANAMGTVQGQMAPDFNLPDLSGRLVSLKDFRGKIVIVDFWATWCNSCRNSIRELSAVDKQYRNKDVVVLGLSIDNPDSFDNNYMKEFLKRYDIGYQILRTDKKTMNDYLGFKNINIPVAFIIDKKGRIVWKIIGYEPGMLENRIKELLPNH